MRVVVACYQVLHRLFVAHPPVNGMTIVGEYFSQCSTPATITYYTYFPDEIVQAFVFCW